MKKLLNAAKKLFSKPNEGNDIFGSKGTGKDCPICGEAMKPSQRMIHTGNFPDGMHDHCWPESFSMALDDIAEKFKNHEPSELEKLHINQIKKERDRRA